MQLNVYKKMFNIICISILNENYYFTSYHTVPRSQFRYDGAKIFWQKKCVDKIPNLGTYANVIQIKHNYKLAVAFLGNFFFLFIGKFTIKWVLKIILYN